MDRHCVRTSCHDVATVTVTYDYGARRVWIVDRIPQHVGAAAFDVCEACADRVTAPRGWDLIDRRSLQRPLPLQRAAS